MCTFCYTLHMKPKKKSQTQQPNEKHEWQSDKTNKNKLDEYQGKTRIRKEE